MMNIFLEIFTKKKNQFQIQSETFIIKNETADCGIPSVTFTATVYTVSFRRSAILPASPSLMLRQCQIVQACFISSASSRTGPACTSCGCSIILIGRTARITAPRRVARSFMGARRSGFNVLEDGGRPRPIKLNDLSEKSFTSHRSSDAHATQAGISSVRPSVSSAPCERALRLNPRCRMT